jgi:signal transduction histidine kinase
MQTLPYFRLITLTAGTLLPFFWMIVILGHRRQRNFERVFFFLCLALTLFCGSSLLALNARLFYVAPPRALLRFAWTFLCLGLWSLPAFAVHLHAEYASLRGMIASRRAKIAWLAAAYLPAALLLPQLVSALELSNGFGFEATTLSLGMSFRVWLVAALLVSAGWQWRFKAASTEEKERDFYKWNFWYLLFAGMGLLYLFYEQQGGRGPGAPVDPTIQVVLWLVILPLVGLIRDVQKYNFLQIGQQRNLIYAVFTVFLALLYLSFVRRAGQWLEPYLPPAATAGLLLFLPVVFFEPLQQIMRGLLRQTAQSELDRAQKLMGPINETARLGDLAKLLELSERWIAEQLQLASAKIELAAPDAPSSVAVAAKRGSEEVFPIARSGRHLGRLTVKAHGAMLSGETYAALEFVAEQLPAAFDLCRLIEEKLQLERELAERERMALVGQMAASISHNLKNPLGSIKTILQVQMESPEMPASMLQETQMVLDEVNRLSTKLNQLLQFSRPGVRATKKGDRCNVVSVASNVVEVLRHEAEPSGVSIEFARANGACEVAASSETVNDILSNVVLNAIEAVGRGGHVRLCLHCEPLSCIVAVEDNGPGIPAAFQEKILTPFFTTKARGTGLGLAIVARRLEEIGGELKIDSPIREERGSRFRVILPLAAEEKAI